MNDLISRQAAIDAINAVFPVDSMKSEYAQGIACGAALAKTYVEQLPSAQPEQRWIPCSERLPEEKDYRGCSECIDGAVWYYTDKGAVGLGYYYESTKEWSTTYDESPYGNVIAWMPLPAPYKECES